MRAVYAAEVGRHLAGLTPEEAELLTTVLEKVTASTCEDAAGKPAPAAAGA